MSYERIFKFKKMGFGLFVHFGLYSVLGKGEWAQNTYKISNDNYSKLISKFKVKKYWAENLVKVAKSAGCKYITLTTCHHDGFALYDTKGLSLYDSVNTIGRDLVEEFVVACRKYNIVPFLYHTLFEWYDNYIEKDFKKNIDQLVKRVELLCKNYGELGGLWFDGWWRAKEEDWQWDRIYGVIRKYQPDTMIINNTGLSHYGMVGHPEIDSVTFERGKPCGLIKSNRPIAGEMCQTFNDHWGYAKEDYNYKSTTSIIEDLVDCRKYDCNFLLNVGPMGNGELTGIDKTYLRILGNFIKCNKNFIYDIHSCELTAEGADVVKDDKYYYAIIKQVPMIGDENVALKYSDKIVKFNTRIKNAIWLDTGEKVVLEKDKSTFKVKPFFYGISRGVRIVRFTIDDK